MNTAAKLLLDGAHKNGLKLIGDEMIGYKFVPASDMASSANKLLPRCFGIVEDSSAWLRDNADGPYDSELWDKEA